MYRIQYKLTLIQLLTEKYMILGQVPEHGLEEVCH